MVWWGGARTRVGTRRSRRVLASSDLPHVMVGRGEEPLARRDEGGGGVQCERAGPMDAATGKARGISPRRETAARSRSHIASAVSTSRIALKTARWQVRRAVSKRVPV